MAARAVPAVRCLFTQANQLAPHRSKASDGTVASGAHSRQNPTSDHEPDEHGQVFAGDLTDDDAAGIDCRKIAAAIVKARDRRVKYLIHEGRMVSSYRTSSHPAWTWRPYGGPNGHFHHLHVSVLDDQGSDTRPWPGLSPHAVIPPTSQEDDMPLTDADVERVADAVYDRCNKDAVAILRGKDQPSLTKVLALLTKIAVKIGVKP